MNVIDFVSEFWNLDILVTFIRSGLSFILFENVFMSIIQAEYDYTDQVQCQKKISKQESLAHFYGIIRTMIF